jgi:hypothetical protein
MRQKGVAKKSLICQECGKTFYLLPCQVKRGQGVFCCFQCKVNHQKNKVRMQCEECGKYFDVIPNRVKKGQGKFCSVSCYAKHHKGSNHQQFIPRVVVCCEQCGKTFEKEAYTLDGRKHFCSRECANLYQIKKVSVACTCCGKSFEVIPARIKKGHSLFCSVKCANFYNRGSNNFRFVHGNSYAPYPAGWRRSLKNEIRKRDYYTCQLCGKTQNDLGRLLCIHHIDYNKDNLNDDNLVSLCTSCHSKTNVNREYWIEYFKGESLSAERG